MKPKTTICLWFDKDADEAARFYAATFPEADVDTMGIAVNTRMRPPHESPSAPPRSFAYSRLIP
jgi:predicted 3-demethylubiquinone-9 3-methyltransferase (glyoxalase superfamily)